MTRLSHLELKQLIEYAEGEVTASQAEAIDKVLSLSAQDRKRLEAVQNIVEHLGDVDDEISKLDLVGDVRAQIDAMSAVSSIPARKTISRGLVSAIAAGILMVISTIVYFQLQPSPGEEFRVKASGAVAPERSRWIGFHGYRVVAGGSPRILDDGAVLSPADQLVFSYTNNGENPFNYLMLFSIDEQGEVFWYYPAYEKEDTDPLSIEIQRDVMDTPLPDAVAHDYLEGTLTLYGLFSDRPVSVSKIEAAVAKETSLGSWNEKSVLSLDLGGTAMTTVKLDVIR